jgi:hypothetical protein
MAIQLYERVAVLTALDKLGKNTLTPLNVDQAVDLLVQASPAIIHDPSYARGKLDVVAVEKITASPGCAVSRLSFDGFYRGIGGRYTLEANVPQMTLVGQFVKLSQQPETPEHIGPNDNNCRQSLFTEMDRLAQMFGLPHSRQSRDLLLAGLTSLVEACSRS